MSKEATYVRTTFYIKTELRERIKKESVDQRRTITEVLNYLLETALISNMVYKASLLPTIPDEEVGRIIKNMMENKGVD